MNVINALLTILIHFTTRNRYSIIVISIAAVLCGDGDSSDVPV